MRNHTAYHRKTHGSSWLVALLAVSASFGDAAYAQYALHAASDAAQVGRSVEAAGSGSGHFECGCRPSQRWVEEVRAAVARGEIPDPATRVIPPIRRGQPRTGSGIMPCLSPAHIFPFEDTNQILLTDYSTGQLIDLMVSAANELMAAHGDIYDFVGFWLNFAPHHTIGTAAYIGLENDVTGIGVQSAVGTELFNRRPDFGVGGQRIEGFLITWNINWSSWQPGTEPGAFMTRVALGHEFEHRFAMFLPDLLDGRRMQGYGGFGCYGAGHPNPGVDSQGSVLGIGEWVGSNPAVVQASYPAFYLFNSDTGGSYSYTELYLMGYVSPAEMDVGNSELRYMDDWDCVAGDYFGPISTFSSADIIAAAGPRVPDSTAEDKHYRTGWIMIHLPGDPPNADQRAKAVAIHEQLQMDWNFSTLGRGTMDNSLFDDCNCNDISDADDIAEGTSPDANENEIPDECEFGYLMAAEDWNSTTMNLIGSATCTPGQCPNTSMCIDDICYFTYNRYLYFHPHNAGQSVALRVRHVASGETRWVDWVDPATQQVVHNNNAPDLLTYMFTLADGSPPDYAVWPQEPIAVTGCFIAPSEQYEIQAIIEGCDPGNEACYTAVLSLPTAIFGDAVSTLAPPGPDAFAYPPQGPLVDVMDMTAVVEGFTNTNWTSKLYCDLIGLADDPSNNNVVVDVSDVTAVVDAFGGDPYPGMAPQDCP